MFGATIKYWTVFEGPDANTDAMSTEYKSLAKAMKAYKASTYKHVLLNEYAGTWSKEDGYDGDYVNTIAERGA